MHSFKLIGLHLLIITIVSACANSEKEEVKILGDNPSTDQAETSIDWQAFSMDIFEKAAEENKLILLEVGANWCHWCHVMDEKTYSDAEVKSYLEEHFILCREDQDSRPDLYAAYKKWGWPAIIAFDADATEIMKLKGYQEKSKFLERLNKVVLNPVPYEDELEVERSELSVSNQELFNSFLGRVDYEQGAYNWNNKYLHLPGLLHGLKYYTQNDSLKNWSDRTAENSLSLVDPVWGGVYQYSALKSWDNQHYEKLLRVQAQYIEGYARYAVISGKQQYTKIAIRIYQYVGRFLSGSSLLYANSQNADIVSGQDSEAYYESNEIERLKQGIPSVDEHRYLKENALLAKSLVYLWSSSGDAMYLELALGMTDYMLEAYQAKGNLFVRERLDESILSMEDNRCMLDLLLLVAQATGDDDYLQAATALGKGIIGAFDSKNGLVAAVGDLTIPAKVVNINNLDAVISFNRLGHLTGEQQYITFAENLFEKLDKQGMMKTVAFLPGLIQAREELETEPFHAVFISNGSKESPLNKKLEQDFFKAIITCPNPYIIFERAVIGEFSEEQELLYGGVDPGTLFICTSTYCSAPITTLSGLEEFLNVQ